MDFDDAIGQLLDYQGSFITGVKRTTLDKMVMILKEADKAKKARDGLKKYIDLF